MNKTAKWGAAVMISILFAQSLSAQYFGRNKTIYDNLDFKVVETPNFEFYHYLENEQMVRAITSYAEVWYKYHQAVLKDTIYQRNPLIFYNNHADFQQTNTISGNVGVGTGGVTEAFKNRVVMPIAMSNQQTIQVLGHEMVHAFQFNTILQGDSTSLQSLSNLPLWVVEGMAEYMSIGSVSPHTAMWMRDAVYNDDIPTLQQMNNPQYFPYRYGHAFWAFLTGMIGDEYIQPFFKAIAMYGFDPACRRVLGITSKDLSERWQQALKEQFEPLVEGKKAGIVGRPILDEQDGGRMNISPAISPNGKYVIFISEKNLFSTDVFLADVNTGEIVKTIASTTRSGNIDAFNFIESAGTWSPNSREIALVGFSKGKNILIIKEVPTGKTTLERHIKGLEAFSNLSWSPSGDKLLMTGLKNGHVDLFLYDIKEDKLEQLTNDPFSEMHPSWMPDGQRIVFSTDQKAFMNGRTYGVLTMNLATMDLSTRFIEHLDVFPGADNLNPQVDTAGHIIFLSNRDGYRNMYSYDTETGKVLQLTDIPTGISGISQYSPAISVERRRDRVLYSLYNKRGYSIYRARSKDLLRKEVDPHDVTYEAAFLPRQNKDILSKVEQQLYGFDNEPLLQDRYLVSKEFKSKFKLDYIGGGAGVGVGTSNTFGTTAGLAGSVDMLFSDILGNNQFFVSLALNGEIQDFGGQVAYINRQQRFNWGVGVSHIPFRSGGSAFLGLDTLPIEDGGSFGQYEHWLFQIDRIFEEKLTVFSQYPFSNTLRIEGEIDAAYYSQSITQYDNYYNSFGQLIYQDREPLDAPSGFALFGLGTALVSDNSYSGLTSPLDGHRYRIGIKQYIGELEYAQATADFRMYRFLRPIGLAVRLAHWGRYGTDADAFFPYYLGNPWYLRGYTPDVRDQLILDGTIQDENLLGSKIMVANAEIRLPFTGPEQLAMIKSNFLFSDLNLFFDAGVSWDEFAQFSGDTETGLPQIEPIYSTGISLRVNVFGAIILEPYYALPLVGNAEPVFGLNFIPGW